MECLLFSGEVPGQGGYLVSWCANQPDVEQCRPELTRLELHDWSRVRSRVVIPRVERLSWRAISAQGHCLVRHDATGQGSAEQAWLAAMDLQLERGELAARGRDALLFLIAGLIRVKRDRYLDALLEQNRQFLDYELAFLGPDGSYLSEASAPGAGVYRFLEKHEAFVQPCVY